MIIYDDLKGYDVISRDIENNFHKHIKKTKEEIKTIVIVGGYDCSEGQTFLDNYPNAILYVFEPVPEFFKYLYSRYGNNSRCRLFNCAISSIDGIVDFYRTSSPGSDSLFKVIENNKSGYSFKTIGSIKVVSKKLCDIIKEEIDLLSVDVQGAELEVLQNCNLNNVNSLFLEVQMKENKEQIVYEGQCFMDDLEKYLNPYFDIHSIGLDNELKNGTGNSFWVKK
jgi:FkbM family methyltransferase